MPKHPIFPLTPLELDRPRHLLFNNAAKIAFEEATGLSALDPVALFGKKWSQRTLNGLLWAGLRHEDPELTLEQVGELLDEHRDRLREIVKAISDAWVASLPAKKEAPADATANPPHLKMPS